MEDSVTSSVSDVVNNKENDSNKERPTSLELESTNFGNDEEQTADDARPTKSLRKSKEFSSSQEDLLSRNGELESPDDGEESSQRGSRNRQSITSTLKSKLRDLSPSRKSPNTSPVSKSERKNSKTKAPSRLPKSPTAWLPASFNQIFSSYKTKCGDFRRLFKDVPDSEQLIVDYSCALQRDILVHGRLYISQNWLCFYANIFGWETFVTIRCTEIITIRKEKTALVIPNAIQVCTDTEKYFFASFISRDAAYTVLFRIWQNALLDQPLSPSELIQLVGRYSESDNGSSDNDDSDEDDDDKGLLSAESGSEGDVDGEMPSDSLSSLSQSPGSLATESAVPENQCPVAKDGDAAPTVSVTPPSPGVTPGTDLQNDPFSVPEGENATDDVTRTESPSHPRPSSTHLQLKRLLRSPVSSKRKSALLEVSAPKEKKESSDLEEEGTASEYHDDDAMDAPVNCVCESHFSREFINEEFPVGVDTLYEYLFTECDFFKRITKARKTKEVRFNPWEVTENGQRRTVTYTIAINHPLGPKSSATREKQHYFQESVPGKLHVVQAEVNNEGIPYGDSFCVTNRYCITRTSKITSRLRVTAEVTYLKSVWGFVRNMIEKNALIGLEDYYQFLVENLRRETTEGQWPSKRKASPTRRHKRNRSLKSKEVIEPATEVSMEVKASLLRRLSPKDTLSRFVGLRSRLPQVTVENPLAMLVTVLLGILLLLNMVLMYRLLLLEQATGNGINWDGTITDLPADADQWSKLLQQQKRVHEIEMRRWRDVLGSSIQLMKQVQQSLDLLQVELNKEQTTGAVDTT